MLKMNSNNQPKISTTPKENKQNKNPKFTSNPYSYATYNEIKSMIHEEKHKLRG